MSYQVPLNIPGTGTRTTWYAAVLLFCTVGVCGAGCIVLVTGTMPAKSLGMTVTRYPSASTILNPMMPVSGVLSSYGVGWHIPTLDYYA